MKREALGGFGFSREGGVGEKKERRKDQREIKKIFFNERRERHGINFFFFYHFVATVDCQKWQFTVASM